MKLIALNLPRDFSEQELAEFHGSGVETCGPRSFGARDQQKFANKLDCMLAKG